MKLAEKLISDLDTYGLRIKDILELEKSKINRAISKIAKLKHEEDSIRTKYHNTINKPKLKANLWSRLSEITNLRQGMELALELINGSENKNERLVYLVDSLGNALTTRFNGSYNDVIRFYLGSYDKIIILK